MYVRLVYKNLKACTNNIQQEHVSFDVYMVDEMEYVKFTYRYITSDSHLMSNLLICPFSLLFEDLLCHKLVFSTLYRLRLDFLLDIGV